MSAKDNPTSGTHTGYEQNVVKSKGANSVSQRDVKKSHNASFGDLFEVVEKETGLPGDEVLYKDPFGFRSGGEPIYYPHQMFKGVGGNPGWEDAFNLFNQEQAKGAEVREAARKVAKSMDRATYSLPIYVSPEVYISSRKDLPLADMIPRSAVQTDTVYADEQTDTGDAGSFAEGGVWPENDDVYANHAYEVVPYGRQNAVTDFVQLAAGSLRSTRSITEESQTRAIRQYEEVQMIQGTNNDLNGFDGFRDFATATAKLSDPAGGVGTAMTLDDVYDQIRRLKSAGASRETIAHVTDHSTFSDIQKDLREYARYDADIDDLNFGFQTLEVGGTRIFESHGCPDVDGGREFWSFDASAFDLAMLQDVTMHPLAKTDATETFATDAYGVFRAHGVEHLYGVENIA